MNGWDAGKYVQEMSDPTVSVCTTCGQRNRVLAEAGGVPHCGKCGKPLAWLAETGASDFEAVVEKAPIPVLIDFWAPWCGPCRIVAPAVERLAEELAGKLKVAKLNTDDQPALAERFGIRAIPTLVLIEGGRERDRLTGALNLSALRRWVEAGLQSNAAKPKS
jgi:thioredoxin 2